MRLGAKVNRKSKQSNSGWGWTEKETDDRPNRVHEEKRHLLLTFLWVTALNQTSVPNITQALNQTRSWCIFIVPYSTFTVRCQTHCCTNTVHCTTCELQVAKSSQQCGKVMAWLLNFEKIKTSHKALQKTFTTHGKWNSSSGVFWFLAGRNFWKYDPAENYSFKRFILFQMQSVLIPFSGFRVILEVSSSQNTLRRWQQQDGTKQRKEGSWCEMSSAVLKKLFWIETLQQR